MSIVDFKEIPVANSGSGEQDTFELFARDFLWGLGYEIEEGPSRGADRGKDLIVVEPLFGILSQAKKRWLVSCKHYAHTGGSVIEKDEIDIIGRVDKFKCQGFIAFYSTLPSSGLSATFNDLKDRIAIEVLDKARIEHFLITEERLRQVLRRYFPNSHKHITQNYTWEKFFTAVLILATGQSSLQERLADAYISALMRLGLEDIPKDMHNEFEEIQKSLTRVKPIGDEGSVNATIRTMGEIEAGQLAEKIVSLYDRYRVNFIDDLRH
jgi:hypothetical protein